MEQPQLGRFGNRRLAATGDGLLAAMQQACNTMEINSPHANVLAALGMDKANSADAVNRLKGVRMAPAQVVHTSPRSPTA